jgi:amino acid transporter
MQESPTAAKGETFHRKLSLLDVVAQSIGFIGPVFSAAFLLPAVAGLGFTGKGAGVSSPLVLIIATIGMCGVAWIVSCYARRIHAAGALYDYVTDGFGQQVGFLAGWIYYGGMTLLAVAIFPAFGGFMNLTLLGNHDVDISWWILALAAIVLVFGMTILGVQVSTRAQLVLAAVSVAVILGWAIYVILKGGTNGNSFTPFNPSELSFDDLFYGLLYACLVFTGFETAANLAEETSEPKRSIPRAVLWSVVGVGAFYVIVMYGLLLAFGLDLGELLNLENFPPLYSGAANPELGGDTFGEIVQWIVLLDILAVALGVANACSRGFFALARDGRLPRQLGAVHPTFRTPWIAAILLAIGSVVVVILTETMDGIVAGADTDPGVWFRFFQFGATYGALGLIIVYLLIALSGFRGMADENRTWLTVAAVVGSLATVAAIIGTVYKAPPIYSLDKVWWLTLIWIVIGAVVTAVLHSRGVFARKTATQERHGH